MNKIISTYSAIRALTSLLLFITIWNARNTYMQSDSQLTLLVSQSILETGDVNLYHYKTGVASDQFSAGDWKYTNRGLNETIYYSYPYGTSFLSLPFVAAANAVGLDMAITEHDSWMQGLLAALSAILIFLLTDRLLQLITSKPIALFISLLAAFGTSYMSTIGTALWSFNFELIFVLLIAIQILRYETGKEQKINPWFFGLLVFATWLCRPSAIGFVGIASAWLMIRQLRDSYKYVIVLASLFSLFVLFSYQTFNLFLPPYYNPFFWQNNTPNEFSLPTRLLAMLFSPARGLFVFTPLLLFAFGGFFNHELRKNKIYSIAAIWFIIQLLLPAMQPNWWGGWCFGPRLLTDALPPILLMLAMTIDHWQQQHTLNRFMPGIVIFGCFGLFTHTMQGMYNNETKDWNDFPNIDKQPNYYIWNWKTTQILASRKNNFIKKREMELGIELDQYLKLLKPGAHLLYGYPENVSRLIYDRWNKNGSPVTLHNNLYSIEKSNIDTFWITLNNLDQIKYVDYYKVIYPAAQPTLGKWLSNNKAAFQLISARDDASTSLSDESRIYLRNLGAKTDSLKFRQGYTAIIQNGKLVAEVLETNDSAAIHYAANNLKIELRSCGNRNGDYSSIKINGTEYSQNKRGMNVVTVEESGKINNSVRFDTHAYDALETKLLPVVRAAKDQKRK